MAVSSVSGVYSSLYTSLLNSTRSTGKTSTESGSGSSTVLDILELGSSENYLSTYLNYDSTGNYNCRATLLDFIDSEEENGSSLADIFSSSNSEDSGSGIFDSLISAKSEEINKLISIAMEKLESKASVSSNATADIEE